MRILLATPTASVSNAVTGNDVTAARWAGIFHALGHEVIRWDEKEAPSDADLLVALHARKSASAVRTFERGPIVVALTGTDLYQDLPENADARDSLRRASAVVVLQPGALDRLDSETRAKTSVIYQSAVPLAARRATNHFQVCVIAHLRDVKNPFLAAEAVSRLDESSPLELVHAGAAMSDEAARRMSALSRTCPRYRWVGPVPHDDARRLIAESHLIVLTSRFEGGANVLSEAVATGTPIAAARAPGIEGFLGASYPGLFPPGDVDALVALLDRAVRRPDFYRELEDACRTLAPLVEPELEIRSWDQLLRAVSR